MTSEFIQVSAPKMVRQLYDESNNKQRVSVANSLGCYALGRFMDIQSGAMGFLGIFTISFVVIDVIQNCDEVIP
jgi:hypothetical protein